MTLLLLTGLGPSLLAGVTPSGGNDVIPHLIAYGVAAPFAWLAWQQLRKVEAKLDQQETKHAAELAKSDAEIARLHGRVEELQKEALQREQQLVAGLGPRIYDAALLYREATGLAEQVSTSPVAPPAAPPHVDRRLDELTELVERLVTGMGGTEGK